MKPPSRPSGQSRLKAGETLLVLGAAGGVGMAAIEIGKAMAPLSSPPHQRGQTGSVQTTGADETINYVSENLRDRINELTNRRGVELVFDPVGGAYTETACAPRLGRTPAVVGFAPATFPKIPINLALLKERSIVGTIWASRSSTTRGDLRTEATGGMVAPER